MRKITRAPDTVGLAAFRDAGRPQAQYLSCQSGCRSGRVDVFSSRRRADQFCLEGQDQFWHVGDGGLADNTGAESLLMVFLKKLQEKKTRRTLIISFDSSFPFFGRRRGTGPPGGRVQSVQL